MRPWCSAMSGSIELLAVRLEPGERAVLVALHEATSSRPRRPPGWRPAAARPALPPWPSLPSAAPGQPRPACSPIARQGMVPAPDLLDDGVGVGGPDEGLGPVVLGEVAVDRGLEVDQGTEGAALQAPPGQGGEEGLDRVRPRARGRGEVEGPAGMAGEPGADLGVLVGGIVVEDGVHQLARRHGRLDAVEEADELLVPVTLHALADDRAVQDVQGREQRGRAMSDIVMGHRTGAALLHRQAGLGAVERLDLGFLVDRQHKAVGRRVEIEPDDIAELGGEGRVLGQLEATHPMRLEPVRGPDPLHRAQGDAGRRRHRAAGPVGRLAGRVGQGELHHPVDQWRRQRRQARLARVVAQQAVDARLHEPPLPAPDAGLGHPRPAHDLGRAAAFGRRQDDPRPPDVLLRAVAVRHDRLQPDTVGGTYLDADPIAHAAACHTRQTEWNPKTASNH